MKLLSSTALMGIGLLTMTSLQGQQVNPQIKAEKIVEGPRPLDDEPGEPPLTFEVDERQVNSFNLSPNPNSGTFSIQMETPSEGTELIILNVAGQVVHRQYAESGSLDIRVDAGFLRKGIYIASIGSTARKFIVS